ncbi:MAG: hypothetical protein R3272_01135 [Candidatus Promineifilaceae bacterium]|nr:hypothetical protein [Candidatus Promineifilaceae bacterium]
MTTGSPGRLWRQLQGDALFAYTRIVTRTAHFNVEGWEHLEAAQKTGRPLLWSLWHEQVMNFLVFGDRHFDAADFVAVTVGDTRGDTLGTVAERLGGKPILVDMQGNPVAAGRAVVRVIQAMRSGKQTLIAPDGPDGPVFEPKGGVAVLAKKAEAAILPIGIYARHAYRLDRWDRYQVPYPFAHLDVAIGLPLLVSRDTEQEALLDEISSLLHRMRDRAREMGGVA